MQKLIEGIHQFQQTIFDSEKHLFERLARGQQPLALFITCSDSRIDPSLLTQTKPGELFILRNAGNIVPPFDAVLSGEAATIEYAVSVLQVKDIIICGHSLCGAMDALLHPGHLDGLNAVDNWLTYAQATGRIIEENYDHVTDKASRVAAAVSRGDLKLHGWTYELETGQVFSYDLSEGQFLPIEHATGIPKPPTLHSPTM
jgi:carbonic anhydrase